MITIDCKDAKPLQHKMSVYVADKLGMLPVLKSDKIILTALDDSQTIDKSSVLTTIEGFLESKKLTEDVQIILDKDIIIRPFEEKGIKDISEPKKELFFECAHCGFVTQYEIEWRSHKLIHYI